MLVTPWFLPPIKPRDTGNVVGVYGVLTTVGTLDGKTDDVEAFSYWDGLRWGATCATMDAALSFCTGKSNQDKIWRGLAVAP